MRKTFYFAGVACAVIGIAVALIARLGIDQREYCRVRFGTPDPYDVILARTSHAMLLYRNGNLEQTPEEYPFTDGRLHDNVAIPAIRLASGQSYKINSVMEHIDDEPAYRHALMINVTIEGDTPFTQYCDVELTGDTRQLKVAHFDGPLSIGTVTVNWQGLSGTRFVIGGDPTDIRAMVATLDKTLGCWTVVESGMHWLPVGVHPTVTVEFPVEQAAQPVVRRYALHESCCGSIFHGPVAVPEGVTVGMAKVTFAFELWTGRPVASTTVDVPVVRPKAGDPTETRDSTTTPSFPSG